MNGFDDLSPDFVLDAVEAYLDTDVNGTLHAFNSYVNRVYGFQTDEGKRLVAKFYRPGRWSVQAIQNEHSFMYDCQDAEIPVVAPIGGRGKSLAEMEGFLFTIFPLKGGRQFDIKSDTDWVRLGAIIGRMHAAGIQSKASYRTQCHPTLTTRNYISQLLNERIIPPHLINEFSDVCNTALDKIEPLFKGIHLRPIHGDCHRGNILDRDKEGLLLIDFDDMMQGPAVQDLWLLLPDHAHKCTAELDMLLYGYNEFCDFDMNELGLIEGLRFMRIIYFLHWCALQRQDHNFAALFKDWGSEGFWIKEIEDLKYQLQAIIENKKPVLPF